MNTRDLTTNELMRRDRQLVALIEDSPSMTDERARQLIRDRKAIRAELEVRHTANVA